MNIFLDLIIFLQALSHGTAATFFEHLGGNLNILANVQSVIYFRETV